MQVMIFFFIESHMFFPDENNRSGRSFGRAPASEEPFPGDLTGALNVIVDAAKTYGYIH